MADDPIEPEVLAPIDDARWNQPAREEPRLLDRVQYAFGPVVGGMVIDSIDLMTFGPLGFIFGGLIGATTAYYICSVEKMDLGKRILLSTLASFYCAAPRTEFIPVATLLGAMIRFFKSAKK